LLSPRHQRPEEGVRSLSGKLRKRKNYLNQYAN
jgi:hypothetical protein